MNAYGGQGYWDEGRWIWVTPPRTPRIRGRRWMQIKQLVLERDGWVCWICGYGGADSCDHVVSLADGGSNGFENLRAAHLRCNLARSARRSTAIRAQKRHRRRIPRID